MTGSAGPNLGLVYGYSAHDTGWGVGGFNPNMDLLDALVFLQVTSAAIATPPGSPAAGDRYVVGASPTGAWAAHAKDLAIYNGSAWRYYTPKAGWRAFNMAAGGYIRFDGTNWVVESSTNLDSIGSTRDQILVRGVSDWGALNVGSVGQVVGVDAGGHVAYINQTGGGAGSGLFATSMSAVPTQSSTGFSTWLNQGAASVSDEANGLCISLPAGQTTQGFHGLYKTAPSVPFSTKALICLEAPLYTQYPMWNFGFFDGTKLEVFRLYQDRGTPGLYRFDLATYNSATSFNAAYGTMVGGNSTVWCGSPYMWVKASVTSTTVVYSISFGGQKFMTEQTVTKSGSFLGSSGYANIYFGVDDSSGGYGAAATMLSYAESSP